MAFGMFKKKEEKYPAEEKAEVLGEEELPPLPPLEGLPELPGEGLPDFGEEAPQELEMAPLPESPALGSMQFRTGFRAPEEMAPPPVRPRELKQLPPMRQMPEEVHTFPEITSRMRTGGITPPHIYIKISKYKDVMETIQNLHDSIQETKQDLEDIHAIGNEEEAKLRESAEVVLKIEELLKYLETTFTQPED